MSTQTQSPMRTSEDLPWSVQVTWFRASAVKDIVIPYPDPKPPTIYPAGTAGWWRPTSDRWGTFIPDGNDGHGVSMANVGLTITDEFEQVTYRQALPYVEEGAA